MKGTGLGLAIVKHIRHRARLEVSSGLRQGATFTVCIRAADAPALEGAAAEDQTLVD
ncbi:MAG: hypothetical protein QNJ43_17730 [Breoghania sp.]|nr:hypothetical protein [Breoghania sp.]MDJ0932346.1 hypothetical protein [Breoghania sp.]